MLAFRIFLVVGFVAIGAYTLPVILTHGINLFPFFFGDMLALTWAGQFNTDFMFFLMLSGLWTMWRNRFTPAGLGLGVLAFFFGFPFLSLYLLVLLHQTDGDLEQVMLGDNLNKAR